MGTWIEVMLLCTGEKEKERKGERETEREGKKEGETEKERGTGSEGMNEGKSNICRC
jgi:hypothetical protein